MAAQPVEPLVRLSAINERLAKLADVLATLQYELDGLLDELYAPSADDERVVALTGGAKDAR